MDKEISQSVSVIVERRPAKSRWADWIWVPAEVIPGSSSAEPFTKLEETADGIQRYFMGSMNVVLHRKETEAYILNMAGDRVLYVVLRCGDVEGQPVSLHTVTASPYEAQDYLDSGEEIVEALPIPQQVGELVEAFCAYHHKEEAFIKRKRDKVKTEELKFGKEPIFAAAGRARSPGEDDDGV